VDKKTMKESGKHLLLFDIDGTLMTSGGAGEGALRDAMKDRFGVDEDLSGITVAGATDTLIARLLLKKHGLAITPENITALLDRYLHFLQERIGRHKGYLLPGILELLSQLARNPYCVTALLTGNLKKGAEIKLSHYGIWEFFQFGAFADDHHHRNELGHFARTRARESHGYDFLPREIFVIGDTPRDVACGKEIGARTVAIATGNYSVEVLRAENPDFVFQDLSDIDAVMSVLL